MRKKSLFFRKNHYSFEKNIFLFKKISFNLKKIINCSYLQNKIAIDLNTGCGFIQIYAGCHWSMVCRYYILVGFRKRLSTMKCSIWSAHSVCVKQTTLLDRHRQDRSSCGNSLCRTEGFCSIILYIDQANAKSKWKELVKIYECNRNKWFLCFKSAHNQKPTI